MSDEQRLNQIQAILAQVSSQDGYFFISEKEDGVYLTVFPPQGAGALVGEAAVLENLAARHVVGYLLADVRSIISEAAGLPLKITGQTTANKEEKAYHIEITLSVDKMEAQIEIDGEVPSLDAVYEKIQQASIRFGVDHEAIMEACVNSGKRVVFARGIRVENGHDAYFCYHVDLEKKAQPKELEDGRVDFKELGLLTQVSQGELIVEKIPATAGKPGVDLWGRRIEGKRGKDIMLPAGKNVRLIDCSKVVAAIDGQVTVEQDKISVVPVIEVDGDVDLSTGNIDFKGNIIVKGNVQNGFSVKAGGDVEVRGTVSGIVEARNITVQQGIIGGKDSFVQAQDDVYARFIQNAIVVAGRDVKVKNVIVNSEVNTGRVVWATGEKGAILGGSICAGEEIFATNIGTDLTKGTDLRVGVNPALRDEYQIIRQDLRKLEDDLNKTEKAANFLRNIKRDQLPPEKQQQLLKLTQAEFHLRGKKENMHRRIAEIEETLESMRFGRIKVKQKLAAGTRISIGAVKKPMQTDVQYVKLFVEKGEIRVASLS